MSEAKTSQLKQQQNTIFDGGQADSQHKLIVPKNSTANLGVLSNEQASLAYDTDQATLVINDGSGFQPIGGSSLPDQSGHSGEFLTTDGSSASWAAVSSGGATTALDNLVSTAVNANILPDNDVSVTLGDNAHRWSEVWTTSIQSQNSTLVVKSSDLGFGSATAAVVVTTGSATAADSGNLVLTSGNAGGGPGTPESGDVILTPGSATIRGRIVFQDGSEGTSGHVWTSTGVAGQGTWAADSANIMVFESSAGAGGSATEALTVTGLLASDTVLSVSQKTPGANSLPLLGWSTLANNSITGIWSADPGAGSVVLVSIKR